MNSKQLTIDDPNLHFVLADRDGIGDSLVRNLLRETGSTQAGEVEQPDFSVDLLLGKACE
jgi:hypothetical protein